MEPSNYPLLQEHPALADALPVPLGLLRPTPLESAAGLADTWIKRDDRSAEGYGGNKIRKLDFVLAEARDRRRPAIVCFGYAGSNFVAATAWHARAVGIPALNFLLPQAPAPYVAGNLRVSLACGAELHAARTTPGLVASAVSRSLGVFARRGRWPAWVPPGGSSPLGAVGFVNAGLELARQLRAQSLPPPERIYIAFSSMGSVAGLALGLEFAGLPSHIHAVRVIDKGMANPRAMRRLLVGTARLLERGGCKVDADSALARVTIRDECYGPGYAQATPAVRAAMDRFDADTGIATDTAYSGKAVACLLADRGDGFGGRALYWHTYAGPPAAMPGPVDPAGVPALLRHHLASSPTQAE